MVSYNDFILVPSCEIRRDTTDLKSGFRVVNSGFEAPWEGAGELIALRLGTVLK